MHTKKNPLTGWFVIIGLLIGGGLPAAPSAQAELTLVENGVSRAPIIVAADAPRSVKQAALELAGYIEKITGARLELIENAPSPLPAHAVWVGMHPRLSEVFPDLGFVFKYPEEILIACNGRNLVITGDGTAAANAVYTFLQDRLDVRRLWPGPLGEDIIRRETLAFKPFEYRFHPPFRQRDIFRLNPRASDRKQAPRKGAPEPEMESDWVRFQRGQFGSLFVTAGCHAFANWWDRFHEDHPDYFALQPDGTRSGHPSPKNAKICETNPDVWEQWLRDAEAFLKARPDQKTLRAHANDGHSSGICICSNCMAWDNPAGKLWTYTWAKGETRDYVAMSDRYVRFFNQLARKLKERFPERDDLLVAGAAYGPSVPPPVEAVAADNVIISFVGLFPLSNGEASRAHSKDNMRGWAEKTSQMHYRPNMFYCAGGVWGFPEVALSKTIEDFRFLAEIGCVGIVIDTAHGHWATQGPQYYLMSQLAWDPMQDGQALMDDYFQRGFGPAADDVRAYWELMESARDVLVESPDYRFGSANRFGIAELMPQAYTDELLEQADAALERAEAKVSDMPDDVYRRRVAFVRAGYDFTRMMVENVGLMARVRATGGRDFEAVNKVAANWNEIERISREVDPFALNFEAIIRRMESRVYMAPVGTHFGPPMQGWIKAAASARRNPDDAAPAEFKMAPAEDCGWELAFSDDFMREEPGAEWEVVDGNWSLKDGWMTGSGTLIATRVFPGFHRLEFEAEAIKPESESDAEYVSDLSPFIHARAKGDLFHTGYFFQFGGHKNTQNTLFRQKQALAMDLNPKILITPGKTHRIIVENDQGRLRMIVDGNLLFEHNEDESLAKAGQDRIGFYFYTPAKIRNVKVHVKPLQDDFI